MIAATTITIGFSESPYIEEGKIFAGENLWREAAHYLNQFPGPDLGYYKTDFTVTFADGEEYGGRYDIGADRPTLGEHIRCFIAGVVDERAWSPSDETITTLTKFRTDYEIGD
jgi:hypothetical protein